MPCQILGRGKMSDFKRDVSTSRDGRFAYVNRGLLGDGGFPLGGVESEFCRSGLLVSL